MALRGNSLKSLDFFFTIFEDFTADLKCYPVQEKHLNLFGFPEHIKHVLTFHRFQGM